MQSLEEFNRKRREEYEKMEAPHPNGLACPSCGVELWDSSPMTTYVQSRTSPPQKDVHCPACTFKGLRLA